MNAPPSTATTDSSPEKQALSLRLQSALRERFGSDGASHAQNGPRDEQRPPVVARAPGRVNLLGGHTDYNDGLVLPATIDRAVHVALRARPDEQVCLHSIHFGEDVAYTPGDVDTAALPPWARYVAGVAAELCRQGHAVNGFEAVIEGDVPLGAGLSSSAALEVAAAMGLGALFSLDLEAVATARLCQRVEQEHVGVECGIMDQFASRLGRAGHALFLDCRTLEHRHLPLPLTGEVCLVVADSGVRRELASSKYNERRRECEAATRHFRAYDDDVRALRDVSEALLHERGAELPEPLFRRARHVVTENERVARGAKLLAEGQIEAFGRLINASHESLAGDYEVSCDELDALVEIARATEGVLGTRMTGAGFGGCTVTLARSGAVPRLQQAIQAQYEERFERTPEIYVVERNLEAGLLRR